MIDQKLIEQIIESNDIVTTIEQYLPLKKSGTNFKACCPFHEEKTPSFVVSDKKQIYKCFGCGKGGNVLHFVKEIEKLSFFEAVEKLARSAGITLPQHRKKNSEKKSRSNLIISIYDLANDYYRKNLDRYGDHVIAYLNKRNISLETVRRFQLGYALRSNKGLYNYLLKNHINENIMVESGLISESKYGRFDLFKERLVFPIHSAAGKVVAFGARVLSNDQYGGKYINSPTTSIYTKGNELYGFYKTRTDIGKKNGAIITEGYLDFIKLYEAGFTNSVASLGTALTERQIKLISRYTNNFYLLYDGDKAGRKASLEAAKKVIATGHTAYIVELPQDEDADSFLESAGSQELAELVKKAKPLPLYLLDDTLLGLNVKEKIEHLLEVINNTSDLLAAELFAKKVAETFNVSLQAITDKIRKQKRFSRTQKTKPSVNPQQLTNKYFEEKMFLIHLLNGSIRDPEVFQEITSDHFFIDIYKKVFELFANSSYIIDDASISSILGTIAEDDTVLVNAISELSLEEEPEISVENTIDDLKLRKLKHDLDGISSNPNNQINDIDSRVRELEHRNKELKKLSSTQIKKIIY